MDNVDTWNSFVVKIDKPGRGAVQCLFDAADMLSKLSGVRVHGCICREQLADDKPELDKAMALSDWREFLESREARMVDLNDFLLGKVKPKGVLILLMSKRRELELYGELELYELSPWASDQWRKLVGDNHWSWSELRPMLIQ